MYLTENLTGFAETNFFLFAFVPFFSKETVQLLKNLRKVILNLALQFK